VLARHQPEIGHELPRVREPRKITHLGYQGDGDDPPDPLERLQGLDDWGQRPLGQELVDLPVELGAAALRLLMGVEIALERDLLGRVREALVRQPDAVIVAPRLAAVAPALLEQEALWIRWRALRTSKEAAWRARTRSRIASWTSSGTPHEGQLAGPQQARQGQGVVRDVLDALARLPRRPGRGNDLAADPHRGELAVQAVAGRPSLVSALDPAVALAQLLD
jgi:hypothetical protein